MKQFSRRWAKSWLSRNSRFIRTLREKPLSAACRMAHNKEDIEGYFKEFERCKKSLGILDNDVYNFDETGC